MILYSLLVFSFCFILYVKKEIYSRLMFNIVCITSLEKEVKDNVFNDITIAPIILRGIIIPMLIMFTIYSYLLASALFCDILVTSCVIIGFIIKTFFNKKIDYTAEKIIENIDNLYFKARFDFFIIGLLALFNSCELIKATLN